MGTEKLPLPLPPPLLLTTHRGEESDTQSFYNLLDEGCHTTSIPVMRNKSVLCSAFGWLVLIDQTEPDSDGECCLWNPTSMEIIKLLDMEYPCSYNRCYLSKPPTDPDCFVLFNCTTSYTHHLYRLGDDATSLIDFRKQSCILLSMVSFQGVIYGVSQPFFDRSKYEFVTVHKVGDKFEAKPLLIEDEVRWEVPQAIRSWNGWNQVYLMEAPCGKNLLLVIKMMFNADPESARHFRVFRVDVGKMECEELDNLNGRTVFMGYYGNGFCRSYSESFGGAIKQNCIYYTDENGRVMYVYDMADRSMTSLLPPYPDSSGIDDASTEENFWVDIPMKNGLQFTRVS